jgi:hypothetical protein
VATEKVFEWLQKTGFPLEMQAASAFRYAGFDVRQSFTFPDPQSEKGREIDVLAQDPDFVGMIEIFFVVECKSSPNPWVVLISDDALSNHNRLFAFSVTSGAAREVLSKRLKDFGRLDPYIKRPARGGYGFRQAFGKDNDPAYAAAIGAMKASCGVAQDRTSSTIPRLVFAFPVIVIDSPLFECSLTGNGELQLTEVEQSDFLFSAHIPDNIGCCVKVVTKPRLPVFAQWAKQLANSIREELNDEEERFFSTKGPEGGT